MLCLPVAGGADIPLRAVRVVMPGSDEQDVTHLEPPGGCAPCGLQNHGPGQVAASSRHRPVHRPGAKASRMPVEYRRKDRRPVHLGQRQPLDIPAGRHERAYLAVGQQSVVGDRWPRTSPKSNVTLWALARRQFQLHATTVLQVHASGSGPAEAAAPSVPSIVLACGPEYVARITRRARQRPRPLTSRDETSTPGMCILGHAEAATEAPKRDGGMSRQAAALSMTFR